MQRKTGDFAEAISPKIIIFPGWDRLQSKDFAALLRTHSNSIGDGMTLKVIQCTIVL